MIIFSSHPLCVFTWKSVSQCSGKYAYNKIAACVGEHFMDRTCVLSTSLAIFSTTSVKDQFNILRAMGSLLKYICNDQKKSYKHNSLFRTDFCANIQFLLRMKASSMNRFQKDFMGDNFKSSKKRFIMTSSAFQWQNNSFSSGQTTRNKHTMAIQSLQLYISIRQINKIARPPTTSRQDSENIN